MKISRMSSLSLLATGVFGGAFLAVSVSIGAFEAYWKEHSDLMYYLQRNWATVGRSWRGNLISLRGTWIRIS